MRSHLEILFELEAREQAVKFPGLRLVSVVLGFGNLLLCAYIGPALAANRLGPPLFLLLFLEFGALLFAHVFYHLSVTHVVLTGTELLPVSRKTRRRFASGGPLRRPFSLALAGPVALLLGLTFRDAPAAAVVGPFSALLAAAGISAWTGALLAAGRKGNPQTITAALLLLLPCVAFLALLLDMDSVLSALPPVGLTTEALRSAAAGDLPRSLLAAGCLGGILVLPFLIRGSR